MAVGKAVHEAGIEADHEPGNEAGYSPVRRFVRVSVLFHRSRPSCRGGPPLRINPSPTTKLHSNPDNSPALSPYTSPRSRPNPNPTPDPRRRIIRISVLLHRSRLPCWRDSPPDGDMRRNPVPNMNEYPSAIPKMTASAARDPTVSAEKRCMWTASSDKDLTSKAETVNAAVSR
jgi:hypothetical protein